jgi:hypothetical protein
MTSDRLSRRFGEGREAKIGQAAPFEAGRALDHLLGPVERKPS